MVGEKWEVSWREVVEESMDSHAGRKSPQACGPRCLTLYGVSLVTRHGAGGQGDTALDPFPIDRFLATVHMNALSTARSLYSATASRSLCSALRTIPSFVVCANKYSLNFQRQLSFLTSSPKP